MRTEYAIKNAKITLIFTIIITFINFLSRGILIKSLGNEIVGLNTILRNMISFLNLSDLGITVAITYALYSPISNNNIKKISEIMSLFKKLYRYIAIIVAILGIVTIPIVYFFVDKQISFYKVIIYYTILVIGNILNYLFTYNYILVNADQKSYIIKMYINIGLIVKNILQIIFLIKFKSYFIYLIIELICAIITIIVNNKVINNNYNSDYFISNKDFKTLLKDNMDIVDDTKNIFWHKIASLIVYQTDSFIISKFYNLATVGLYSNYMMIINNISNIISQVIGSIIASIGSLATEKNVNKSYEIFKELYALDFIIANIIVIPLYLVIQDFIKVWIGESYILSNNIIIVMMINLYLLLTRLTLNNFKTAYGIFWDKFAPVIEGILNLIFSILLVKFYGLVGVLVGTLISNIIIINIWIPYIVFKEAFNKKFTVYLLRALKMFLLSTLCIGIVIFLYYKISLYNSVDNYFDFFCKGIIIFIITFIITSLVFFLFEKSFRNFLKRLIKNK